MIVSVLSGKGGTGKTFAAVNLAYVAGSAYMDCDVEEPNGALYFQPDIISRIDVSVMNPAVDKGLCNECRQCVEFCKFNALAMVKNGVLIFTELCHSCEGCVMVCPQKALSITSRNIGSIEYGRSGEVSVYSGIMNMGEITGVPVIKKLLKETSEENMVIDCPPGSSCAVMESIQTSDYCVLVTEPTIFGVHNLALVLEMVRLFGKKCGVIINKIDRDNNVADIFCMEQGLDVIARIPFNAHLGVINSRAQIAARGNIEYRTMFENIWQRIGQGVQYEADNCSQW